MGICRSRWLRAWEKHSWCMYVYMYGCSVWGWLSNLKHVSLYWCIIMYNSSAAAVPINVSLQFTCCHIPAPCNNYTSITILFACHAKAEWSSLRCGEFLFFKTIKTSSLTGRFSLWGLSVTLSNHVLQLLMGRQSVWKTSGDFVRQVPLTLCPPFSGKPEFSAVRSLRDRQSGEEVWLIKACARAWANKQGGDYFSTHDAANSEWIKSDPAHSADKPNPCHSRPLASVFLTNAPPTPRSLPGPV